MFGAEALLEVWSTIARHKLRSILTGLSVAWGVFVLIVLLGAGKGLQNGAYDTFRRDALNSVWVTPGTTSVPFGGQRPGRKVKLDNSDYQFLKTLPSQIDKASGNLNLRGQFAVRYGSQRASFVVRGVHPEMRYLENTNTTAGRFLNDRDLEQQRKVAVIGVEVAKFLFDGRSPIGEYIQIKEFNYLVVGVYDDPGADEKRTIFVPTSTLQLMSGSSSELHDLGFTVTEPDLTRSRALVEKVRRSIANRHHFSEEDPRAVRAYNNLEFFSRVSLLFVWIRVFVWVVGVGTLLAGMVGVSNIMLISVKERTQEIGIRKAIGATPGSIVRMIVAEALVITAFAGYLGLLAGITAVVLTAEFLPKMQYLQNPEVDFNVALSSTALIVLAGSLAGYFPARQAAAVNPITTLRTE